MPWEAFLLGLSSGTYCAVACAPVALPFLTARPGSDRPFLRNAALLALLLAGRFVAYIAVGAGLGALGAFALHYADPRFTRILSRAAYAAAGALMIAGGLAEGASAGRICVLVRRIWRPGMGAFIFGLLTGASICPPFFAAAARVFAGTSVLSGAGYFLFFFLGTSIWILPLLALPALVRQSKIVRFFARAVMTMLGVYFLLVVGLLGVM